MTELATRPDQIITEYPFGQPEPDAVALAAATSRALEHYSRTMERGRQFDDGITVDDVALALELAKYRFRRAVFGSIRYMVQVPRDLHIKHATNCHERADADTGMCMAPLPPGKTPADIPPDDIERLFDEGAEMAVFLAYVEGLEDRRKLAEDIPYQAGHMPVLRAALRFAFLAAEQEWQQNEMLWAAGMHNLGDLVSELWPESALISQPVVQ